jgi:hypothetical protein
LAGVLLLAGTVVFVLLYRFAEPLGDFLARSGSRQRPSGPAVPPQSMPRPPRPGLPPTRGLPPRPAYRSYRLPLRDIMAVLWSIVFGVWALYILMSHPDAIIRGPIYDAATKQAATGAMGAILGMWLGKGIE